MMELLKMLQEIRTPWLDTVMQLVTEMGDETFFMLIGLVVIWCVNKTWGFRIMLAGLTGTAANQLLKAVFLIPRPWILDPGFAIVESAKEGASGYSFPSGHTHSAVSIFGMLACWLRRKWVTALCVALVLLVAFSRMCLGVHTPLDVGASLVLGTVMVLGTVWLCKRGEGSRKGRAAVWCGALVLVLLSALYITFAPVTERNVAEFDAHGVESIWKLFGATLGMVLAWYMDEYYTHYETKAPLWAQAVKLIGGAAIVLGVKAGLKPVFIALMGDGAPANVLRYCLMAFAGGGLWPMAFRFFAKPAEEKHPAM